MQERILCSQGKASKDIAPQSREIFTDVCMVAGGGGEFTNLPLTIQAFVNFSDFSRLDLCWLSTNHFQIWRLY